MINLDLSHELEKNPRILLLGAHCDDIEIGCGGTLQQLINKYPALEITWVVFSSSEIRFREAKASADGYLYGIDKKHISILDFKNGFFPSELPQIKKYFEKLKQKTDPAIIFTHYRNDLHQDHRTINELTWNTFRNHLILEYEIVKYDGDLGIPNTFVPLQDSTVVNKISELMKHYQSQLHRQWFTANTFEAIMRIRGVECNSDSGFAEAFYCKKMCLS